MISQRAHDRRSKTGFHVMLRSSCSGLKTFKVIAIFSVKERRRATMIGTTRIVAKKDAVVRTF
jgi:hypothetical protein